jgi:hypothetical protein
MQKWVKKVGRILALPTATAVVLFGARFVAGAVQSENPPVLEGPPVQARIRIGAALDAHACFTRFLIGTAKTPSVVARKRPNPEAPIIERFGRRNVQGGPQVFLLRNEAWAANGGLYYRALLPVRPNGTTGFVPADRLRVSWTDYHLVVDRHALRLTLWKGCRVAHRFHIGLGTKETPTPVGHFYLAVLMKPPNPKTVYGAYAYGLSGYSKVIRNWRWGGVIGLHGTNKNSSVGHRVSHGCIRMRNSAIKALVRILPLGTPITIR